MKIKQTSETNGYFAVNVPLKWKRFVIRNKVINMDHGKTVIND